MPAPTSQTSVFGWSYGWSYALAAFTLVVTGCLPVALLATMNFTGSGADRASALMAWLIGAAAVIAVACVLFFFTTLRHRVAWQRHALMVMWALSALGMVGWWKL